MVKLLVAVYSVLLIINSAYAMTSLEATVSSNPVQENETFKFQLIANDSVNADMFDAAVLQRDFIVGQVSVSRQSQYINGISKQQTIWSVPLIPRALGYYTLPKITIKGISSQAIAIEVIPKSSKASLDQPVTIRASLNKLTAYQNEMLIYTVKLYIAGDLQNGTISTPQPVSSSAAFLIKQLGADKRDYEILNGKRYLVITRQFTVVIHSPGDYQFAELLFQGDLILSSGNDFFTLRQQTQPIMAKTSRINIAILPLDAAAGSLVTPKLSISQHWTPNNSTVKLGSVITRTVTITGVNLTEQQLPKLRIKYPDSLRTYQDKEELTSEANDDGLISQKIISEAIIPTKKGDIELPGIKIPWWNSQKNKLDYAVLPKKTITVTVGDSQIPATTDAPIGKPNQLTANINQNNLWQVISLILAILWLMTLTVFIYRETKRSRFINNRKPVCQKKASHAQIKKLTYYSSPKDARIAILLWAKKQWPKLDIKQLRDIPAGANLTEELQKLEQCCWSNISDIAWHKDRLLQLLKEQVKQQTQKPTDPIFLLNPK